MRVWYHGGFASDARASEAIAGSLLRGGLEMRPVDRGELAGPGLILFDSVTPQVCDAVRALADGGAIRVLGVATTAAALAGDQSWRLLLAGAADALSWGDPVASARAVVSRLERWMEIDRIML